MKPLHYPNNVSVYLTKRGHQVEWYENGERKHALRRNRDAALALAAEKVRGQSTIDVSSATVEEVGREWVSIGVNAEGWGRSHTKNTKDHLRLFIVPNLQGPIAKITRPQLAEAAGAIRDSVKTEGYRVHVLQTLRRLWTYAVQTGYVPQDRAGWVILAGRGKRVQGHSREFVDHEARPDTQSVLKLAPAMRHGLEGAVLVAAFSGLRWGETAGLTPSQLDFEQGLIDVTHQGQWQGDAWVIKLPKGEKTRKTIMPDVVAEVLGPLAAERGTDERLFSHEGHGAWRPNNFHHYFRHAGKQVGWKEGWDFHSLRHHFATWLLGRGLPIQDVAMLMGHSSPDITMRTYVGVSPGVFERAHEIARMP